MSCVTDGDGLDELDLDGRDQETRVATSFYDNEKVDPCGTRSIGRVERTKAGAPTKRLTLRCYLDDKDCYNRDVAHNEKVILRESTFRYCLWYVYEVAMSNFYSPGRSMPRERHAVVSKAWGAGKNRHALLII